MMMHDAVLSRAGVDAAVDRRAADRVPCPAEVTIVWHHDLETVGRYGLRDVSDDGLRLTSSMPMIAGMTGILLRILPEGKPIERSVTVVWQQQVGSDGQPAYEVGLRYM